MFVGSDVRYNRAYCTRYENVRKLPCVSSPPQHVLSDMLTDLIQHTVLGDDTDPALLSEADRKEYQRWALSLQHLRRAHADSEEP